NQSGLGPASTACVYQGIKLDIQCVCLGENLFSGLHIAKATDEVRPTQWTHIRIMLLAAQCLCQAQHGVIQTLIVRVNKNLCAMDSIQKNIATPCKAGLISHVQVIL